MSPGAWGRMLRCGAAFRWFKGCGGSSTETLSFMTFSLFFWPQERCSRGIRRGKSDVQWRGGSYGFSGVEDYRSLRRFCVFSAAEARAALLGLLEMALVGLARFAKVQTIVILHLGKMWARGTCV